MLCRHPFVRDRKGESFTSPHPKDWLRGVPFGCGKCLACRVKTRREWTSRLILEMLGHDSGAFVTLTYSEDYVPVTESGHRTLSLRDLQLFLKRLRRNLEERKKSKHPIRYYACGEYGTRGTQRPHYHIIFFGVSDLDLDFIKSVYAAWSEPAKHGQKGQTPQFGNITIEPLNAKTVAYTAGYNMKKLISPKKVHKVVVSSAEIGSRRVTFEKLVLDRKNSNRDDNGVLAEFRVMSRMPGLGSGRMFDLVALYKSNAAFRKVLSQTGDVPGIVRCWGRTLFLDRFLKNKLRELLNIEPNPEAYYADVRSQFFDWLNNPGVSHATDFYDYLVHQDDQRFKQLQDRIKRQLQRREKI